MVACLYSILLFIVFWYCHTLIFDLLPDFWFSSDTFNMQNNIKKIVFFWLIFSLLQEVYSAITGLLMWILNLMLCTWFTLVSPEEILHENYDASLPLTQKPRMHAILSNTACFADMHSRFLLSVEFSFPQDFFSLQPWKLCFDSV